MAVSKRTRFEVLRRDNHTCRYCGGHAPDVVLTMDHVMPVALGGADDPTNLVTACSACNSGKTSTSPSESIVADVSADAIRWAQARKVAAAQLLSAVEDEREVCRKFYEDWTYYLESYMLPDDWRRSVTGWVSSGLPYEVILDAIRIAYRKNSVTWRDKFRYMSGVIRNRMTELDKATSEALEASGGA